MTTEFQFGAYSNILLFTAVIAFFVIANGIARREKKQNSKILPEIVKNIRRIENPFYSLSNIQLVSVALTFIVLSLMRPQWGYQIVKGVHEGVDVIIAADVSDSMLAEDVKPDRLNVERRKIEDLLELLYGDRAALISFSGASFIESPLTLDYNSIKILSKNLNTDLVPLKGSNFESVALSASSLIRKRGKNTVPRDRALIIFSDGEFEPETLSIGMKILKENKITPFIILIGTEEGAPVPSTNGFKKDREGKLIVSKANFEDLKTQFSEAGGIAIRSTLQDTDLKEIYLQNIKKNLRQSKIDYNNVKKWNEYYQFPLTIGIILLVILWGKNLTISKSLNSLSWATLFFIVTLSTARAQDLSNFQTGLRLYEEGDFSGALEKFNDQEESPVIAYDKHIATGNAFYRLGNFKSALEEFGKAQSLAKTPKDRAKSLFNTANTLAQLGDLQKSLEIYEQAKKEAPKDKEIQNNIDYVNRLLKNLNENRDKDKEEEKEKEKEKNQPKDQDSKEEDNKDENSQNQEDNPNPPEKDQDDSSKEDTQKDQDKEKNQKSQTGSDDEKNNDNESENETGSKSDEKDDMDNQEGDTESDNPNQKEDRQESKNESSEKSSSKPLNDQLESQLESIEENTNARNQYRYKKALEQMERERRQFPTMDW